MASTTLVDLRLLRPSGELPAQRENQRILGAQCEFNRVVITVTFCPPPPHLHSGVHASIHVSICEQWGLQAPLGAAELYREGSCCWRCLFPTSLMIRGHFSVFPDQQVMEGINYDIGLGAYVVFLTPPEGVLDLVTNRQGAI